MSKDYLDKWEERQKQNTEIIEKQQAKTKKMNCVIDKYNKLGIIPCLKCGLDLLERRGTKTICNQDLCNGVIITMETLKIWSKEQGKTLKFKPKQRR